MFCLSIDLEMEPEHGLNSLKPQIKINLWPPQVVFIKSFITEIIKTNPDRKTPCGTRGCDTTDLLFPSVCLVTANQGMRSLKTAGQISHIPYFPESKTLTWPWGSPPENSSGGLLSAAVLAVPSQAYRLHWWSCWGPAGRKIPPNQPQPCPFLLSLTRCRKPRCWRGVLPYISWSEGLWWDLIGHSEATRN